MQLQIAASNLIPNIFGWCDTAFCNSAVKIPPMINTYHYIVERAYQQSKIVIYNVTPPAPLNKSRLLNMVSLLLSLVVSQVRLYGIYTLRISYKCHAVSADEAADIFDRDTISFQRRHTDIIRGACAAFSIITKPCFTAKV